MNRALRAAKENIDLLVTIAGAVGFGSVAAMAEDARQMIAEHPASCLLLTGAAAMLGYATARIVTVRGARAKRRRMDERLSAVFLGMSRRRKELVSRALDEGSVSLPTRFLRPRAVRARYLRDAASRLDTLRDRLLRPARGDPGDYRAPPRVARLAHP